MSVGEEGEERGETLQQVSLSISLFNLKIKDVVRWHGSMNVTLDLKFVFLTKFNLKITFSFEEDSETTV